MRKESTKRASREAARANARLARKAEQRRTSRNRALLISGTTLGVVAIAVVIALVIANGPRPVADTAGPANLASDGIVLTGADGTIAAIQTPGVPQAGTPTPTDETALPGSLHIVAYEDYFCPVCGAFQAANGQLLRELVTDGSATLEIHPVAILDRSSMGTRYSTRAANAAACVAAVDPDSYLDVHDALYAHQPEEGTPGLTDDELLAIVRGAGVTDPGVADCIAAGSYEPWVTAATQRASSDPALQGPKGFATPTIVVNGQRYPGTADDAAAFRQFLDEVSSES